jgi:hypothetical protein
MRHFLKAKLELIEVASHLKTNLHLRNRPSTVQFGKMMTGLLTTEKREESSSDEEDERVYENEAEKERM